VKSVVKLFFVYSTISKNYFILLSAFLLLGNFSKKKEFFYISLTRGEKGVEDLLFNIPISILLLL